MSAILTWVLEEALMPLPLSVPPGVFDTDQTNLRPHTPKWREMCSISHTRIETPTSGSVMSSNVE